VAKALRALGHTVHELDPKEPSWELPPGTQVVFLALHGTYGEDGTVQEQLEKLGVPYTGCGPGASRVAFDKVLTKKRCVATGVPTARFACSIRPKHRAGRLEAARGAQARAPRLERRIANRGTRRAMGNRPGEAFRYDTAVLMEERIIGREATVESG